MAKLQYTGSLNPVIKGVGILKEGQEFSCEDKLAKHLLKKFPKEYLDLDPKAAKDMTDAVAKYRSRRRDAKMAARKAEEKKKEELKLAKKAEKEAEEKRNAAKNKAVADAKKKAGIEDEPTKEAPMEAPATPDESKAEAPVI